jgi:hypothetical protein
MFPDKVFWSKRGEVTGAMILCRKIENFSFRLDRWNHLCHMEKVAKNNGNLVKCNAVPFCDFIMRKGMLLCLLFVSVY